MTTNSLVHEKVLRFSFLGLCSFGLSCRVDIPLAVGCLSARLVRCNCELVAYIYRSCASV